MNEKEFLASYEREAFPAPLVTVDSVLFTFVDNQLNVLLVKRDAHPDKGKWALPGGFIHIEQDADLEAAAYRKLKEKTGVIPPYLEQLSSVGNRKRDKRGWSVTVCYTALMAYQDCQAHVESVSDASWFSVDSALDLRLAFDHRSLVETALERLRHKALYSIVPGYALGESFTLPELQQLHEALIGKPLQKRSFRRRIEQADLLVDTGKKRTQGGRPATLYRMTDAAKDFTFLRNLES